MEDLSFRHRFVGFLAAEIPQGPPAYRWVGRLLKTLAVLVLLGLGLALLAIALAFLDALLPGAIPAELSASWPADPGAMDAQMAAAVASLVITGLSLAMASTYGLSHALDGWMAGEPKGLWGARIAGALAAALGLGVFGDLILRADGTAATWPLAALGLSVFLAGTGLLVASLRSSAVEHLGRVASSDASSRPSGATESA